MDPLTIMGVWQSLTNINEGWLALGGAIFGGAGLEVIRKWLERSKDKDETAKQFRSELRADVVTLRDELRKVNTDLDLWRGKYYELMDQFIKVKGELDSSLRYMRDKVDDED